MPRVYYCDLCNVPLKDNDPNQYILYVIEAKELSQHFEENDDYVRYLERIDKQLKRICPICKHVFDNVFKLRMENLSKISDELLGIYKKPAKEPKNNKGKK